jgi:putative nucleotidyltransferase with HDIG domain
LSGDRGAVELATAGAELLRHAREREAHGGLVEAIAAYDRTIEAAVRDGDEMVLAEALRRVAIVRHHRGDTARARQECRRSYSLARAIRNDVLAAEALNTLGGLDLTTGFLEDARHAFIRALELAEESMPLRARVEQNLGIVANIQGELDAALVHYRRSLDAYRAGNDQHGCAIAYNNLGMVSADRERWDEAEDYFRKCHGLALAVGDRYLQGLVLVNQAEVDVARQRFENGRRSAEQALLVFAELGATNGKSDAYRVIGSIYRETGRPALSESRLRTAVDLAEASGSVLAEAEAHRELALLFQGDGRNQDALRRLNTAHRLFRRLDARAELVYVGGKMAELEGTYRAVVRDWGRAIELRHRGTFGHSERVARHAVAVARALGLEPQQETAILLGAYLHDVGKTRIPPEVLQKEGVLSVEERELMRMHPIWGVELLHDVEFPWPLKSIIRWHHERYDGSGYPDGLEGDQIPLEAQVVGLVEVYDALLTQRQDGTRYSEAQARAFVAARRGVWWSAWVVDAFLKAC